MNHPRVARSIGIAAGVAILLAGAVAVSRWTLIPLELDAGVVDSSNADSTTGHLRTLAFDDGRTITVDRSFIERAGGTRALLGAMLQKRRWDRQVHVDGHPVPLSVPADLYLTMAALASVIGLGWWMRSAQRSARAHRRQGQAL